MQIVYNPPDGAPISGFVHEGIELDSHYPANYKLEDGVSNGLVQYEDGTASKLVETYGFLKIVTSDEVKKLATKVVKSVGGSEEFRCEYPGCDFTTGAAIALAGHKRSHKGETIEENGADESVIPVSRGTKIEPRYMNPIDSQIDIQNGPDADGVNWYGEGVTVENQTFKPFQKLRPRGKGHFLG